MNPVCYMTWVRTRHILANGFFDCSVLRSGSRHCLNTHRVGLVGNTLK